MLRQTLELHSGVTENPAVQYSSTDDKKFRGMEASKYGQMTHAEHAPMRWQRESYMQVRLALGSSLNETIEWFHSDESMNTHLTRVQGQKRKCLFDAIVNRRLQISTTRPLPSDKQMKQHRPYTTTQTRIPEDWIAL